MESTLSVLVFSTVTSSESTLDTYVRVPSGVTAMPDGPWPAGTVAMTRPLPTSTTDTLSEPLLATRTLLPSGVIARPVGRLPTVMLPSLVFVAVLITLTALESLSAT